MSQAAFQTTARAVRMGTVRVLQTQGFETDLFPQVPHPPG